VKAVITIQQINGSLIEDLHQKAIEQALIPLLATYQMMPQLVCESVIDHAIANVECTSEEINAACQQFYQQWNLITDEQQQIWRSHSGLNQAQFEEMTTRSLRIEKFKQYTWGHKLESHFLERKQEFDRVIYSLLRTKDQDLAQELFFRLSEDEQSFAELARQHSEGSEAETGGLVGPVELGTLHPKFAELLYTSRVGHVQPFGLGEWCMVVRLEKLIPAQLDDPMRQRLLQEKFDAWLQEQVRQLPNRDKVWLRIVEGFSD
jgi:parvulin-like peptidyl-prolyl isomerase